MQALTLQSKCDRKEEESMSVVNGGQKIYRLCDKYHSCRLHIIAQKLQTCFRSEVQDQAQAMPL